MLVVSFVNIGKKFLCRTARICRAFDGQTVAQAKQIDTAVDVATSDHKKINSGESSLRTD